MTDKTLRIAWLGSGPAHREAAGVPGVATELLHGLTKLGHDIDCFLPGAESELPARLAQNPRLNFVRGTSELRWQSWYNRTKIGVFVTGLVSRGLGSLRLQREVVRRHRVEPYDLIYQFSNIESLSLPRSITREVPLVIHPETHAAGELRFLLAERQLSYRCEPRYSLVIAATTMWIRAQVQRVRIRKAGLLVCISSVFRDHLVNDYSFPLDATVVIPNPVRLERFVDLVGRRQAPATILVLGRIAVRKGVEDVVAVARALLEQGVEARIRVVGGPSLWSDYTKLLEDLPAANSEYTGRIHPSKIPEELAQSDILLQASKYEPFGLTVAEALSAGAPVIATAEVGAIEGVKSSVAAVVAPGDVAGMVTAIIAMLEALNVRPTQMRAEARAEAERLFAPDVVCKQISTALQELVDGTTQHVRRADGA